MIRSVLLTLFLGCSTRVITVGDMREVAVLSTVYNHDLDVLFVIDNSPSMADKQTAMLASFPHMMDQLAHLDGGMPNLHIAVATTDLGTSDTNGGSAPPIPGSLGGCAGVGDNGALQNPSGMVAGNFISDVSDGTTRQTNYTGTLGDAFMSIANVGSSGCGFEQPLGAMQRALATNPSNAGFLRPAANLAIVILADEDDCTVTDSALFGADTSTFGPRQSFRCTRFGVTCDDGGADRNEMTQVGTKSECHENTTEHYVASIDAFASSLKQLKDDPSKVMVAAIVGDRTPVSTELRLPAGSFSAIPALAHSCEYTFTDGTDDVADPAVRIGQFIDQFPGRGALESVCGPDLTLPLTHIGLAAKQLMGDPCLPVAVANPAAPSCEVIEDGVEVPACTSAAATNCFRIVRDAARCAASPDQLRVELSRIDAPGAPVYDHVRCVTAP